jgi:hypothetical protein
MQIGRNIGKSVRKNATWLSETTMFAATYEDGRAAKGSATK